mmetsp:Transcript_9258/g.25949  ORF Transcript_9258/g.25949 Transcript_9258/m.25949 type:complete len:205 (-) Transcript_9258:424-1038(-)
MEGRSEGAALELCDEEPQLAFRRRRRTTAGAALSTSRRHWCCELSGASSAGSRWASGRWPVSEAPRLGTEAARAAALAWPVPFPEAGPPPLPVPAPMPPLSVPLLLPPLGWRPGGPEACANGVWGCERNGCKSLEGFLLGPAAVDRCTAPAVLSAGTEAARAAERAGVALPPEPGYGPRPEPALVQPLLPPLLLNDLEAGKCRV